MELVGYKLWAKDGNIGKVKDIYFNDGDWVVRYVVVHTGRWIMGRKVLISLQAIKQPVWASKTFPVDLTREQVRNSPDVDLAKPVSRKYEEELHRHYNWPAYWGMSAGLTGHGIYIPPQEETYPAQLEEDKVTEKEPRLRSAKEISGYSVATHEGPVGTMEDYIVDDQSWLIHYMVTNLSEQLKTDKKVLIAMPWIDEINLLERRVYTHLTRDAIQHSPAFDPNIPANRQLEEVLYDYHGQPKYWQVIDVSEDRTA